MKNRLSAFAAAAAALVLGLAAPAVSRAQASAAGPTIDVERYVVQGALPLTEAQVQAALAPHRGKDRSLADIQAAARALEQRLRDGGHLFHRVYVPAQRPTGGEIRLEVVQFRLGEVEVTGNQHFSEANIRASLPTLREGDAPELERLGADISASNTNPAKQTSVTFRESRQPGAVDAVVRVRDAPPSSFIASSSANYALREDDPHNDVLRLTGAWQHANLFDRDHVVTLSYTTDPRDAGSVSLFGAYYQVPFYGAGVTASAFYTASDIDSGRVLQGLNYFDVSGSGRFSGLRLAKALRRIGSLQPTLGVTLENRLFRNRTTFNGVQLQPDVGSRVLSLQAALRDDTAWGLWSAALERAANTGGGSDNTEATHAVNGGEQDWQLWRWSAEAAMAAGTWQLAGRLRGQLTDSQLIPGEQFGLGGSNSVRGFGDRVVTGERGVQWNLEAIGPAWGQSGVRPLLFVEGGAVRALATGRKETLAAAGAGVRWGRPGWQLALDLARVLNDASTSADSQALRLHLGVLARF